MSSVKELDAHKLTKNTENTLNGVLTTVFVEINEFNKKKITRFWISCTRF